MTRAMLLWPGVTYLDAYMIHHDDRTRTQRSTGGDVVVEATLQMVAGKLVRAVGFTAYQDDSHYAAW